MAYPGDQGKPGAWPVETPSSAANGPDGDRRGAPPYGASWEEGQADLTQPAPATAPETGAPYGQDGAAALYGQATETAPYGVGGEGGADLYAPLSGNDAYAQPAVNDAYAPPPGNEAYAPPPPDNAAPYGPPQNNEPYAPPPSNDPYGPPLGDQYSPGGYGGDAYGASYEEGPGMPGPGGPSGPGGPGDFGAGPPPPKKRSGLLLIIGAAAAAGLLLVGGGVVLSSMLKDDPKANAGNTSSQPSQKPSAQPSPTQPVLDPVKLKSRTTDPNLMTLGEAFARAKFTGGGEGFVRQAANHKRDCTDAVNGTKLTAVIKKGGCAQVLRATYSRTDGLLTGTVGVFNLKTEYAAKLAQKAALAKDAFLEPVPGKGYSKKIGRGEALGTAEARGHYLLMTWVQRPDGKKVPEKYHAVVSTFGQHLIQGSGLGFALHYRETEGKPYRN